MGLKDYAGAITAGAGTIAGWLGIGEGRQDRRQVEQQEKLNAVNAKTQLELAQRENEMRLKMWKDTNYNAQLRQAELAGVSKAAALGGSGTGTQGASVSGISGGAAADAASTANARTNSINQTMMLASQLALQKAQKDNINADTKLKLSGAVKTEGIDTQLGQQELDEKKLSQQANIDRKIFEAQKAGEEWTKAIGESQITNQTVDAQVTKLRAEAAGAILANAATKTGIKLDQAKIREISEKIAQGWESLKQGESKIAVDRFKEEVKANYPGLFDVMGRVVDDSIEALFSLKGGRNVSKPMR